MKDLTVAEHELGDGISVSLREQAGPEDLSAVRRITESSGFFSAAEIEVAVELIQARLSQGALSGYHFLFADASEPVDRTIGYSCFGPIPCTVASFDLYWIVVHDTWRRIGLGTLLLAEPSYGVRVDDRARDEDGSMGDPGDDGGAAEGARARRSGGGCGDGLLRGHGTNLEAPMLDSQQNRA